MRDRIRNGAAITIAGLCLACAVPTLLAPPMAFTGITLRLEGSTVVVASVDPASQHRDIIQPGVVVSEINYTPSEGIAPKLMDAYLRGDFVELGVTDPTGGTWQLPFSPPPVEPPAGFILIVAIGMLLGVAVWVGSGQAGDTLRSLALPLAVAMAAPLMLASASSGVALPPLPLLVVLSAVGQLPLADGLIQRIHALRRRRVATAGAVGAAVSSAALGYGVLASQPADLVQAVLGPLAMAASAAILVLPAASVLASSRHPAAVPDTSIRPRPSDRVPVLLAALSPSAIALSYGYGRPGAGLSLPLVWLLLAVVVLQTHTRFEGLRIQRDAVVAATEVERSRLAANLHDDALQEMTVLVRQLDDAGDARSASLARSVADRLREVCGELRLPILDELGAGSALEWLVERVAETSGRPVQLVRDDTGRPPADVELAIFRVAQEALANAVTHGAPPIVVRYAAARDRATLSVTDRGTGLAAEAAAAARRSGHYGLLNMRQRAEQIGATIDMRRPPDGGTAIGVSWSSS